MITYSRVQSEILKIDDSAIFIVHIPSVFLTHMKSYIEMMIKDTIEDIAEDEINEIYNEISQNLIRIKHIGQIPSSTVSSECFQVIKHICTDLNFIIMTVRTNPNFKDQAIYNVSTECLNELDNTFINKIIERINKEKN